MFNEDHLDILLDSGVGEMQMMLTDHSNVYYEFVFYKENWN
jgi:hypothetical protein